MRPSLPPEPLHEDRVVAALGQVGQDHRDRLADDPAAVGGHTVLRAQREPRALEGDESVLVRRLKGL